MPAHHTSGLPNALIPSRISFATRVQLVKYRTDHRRPFIPGGRIRMCRFQLGMVTIHRFLIIDHPRKQTVCRSIVKRNVRTQIDQSRNHDKEYDTGTDCLKKITLKDIYNMPVRDRSGTSAGLLHALRYSIYR